MIGEFDTVKLKKNLLNVRDSEGDITSLPSGSIGTVVMVYDKRVGSTPKKPTYEVDFCDDEGNTIALLMLEEDDLALDRSHASMRFSDAPEEKRRAG